MVYHSSWALVRTASPAVTEITAEFSDAVV